MSLSYDELTEILLASGESFSIEQVRPDGKVHLYRGKDAHAFLMGRDGRRHEHKVFAQNGDLLYHRDVNGKLHVGSERQWELYRRRAHLGRSAVGGAGMISDAFRKAMRFWFR